MNFSFRSICMQHTDKNVPRKWLLGGIFWYCVLQDCWSFQGLRPLDPPPGLCPGPTGELIAPPRQPNTQGNEIRSLHIVPSAGYHFHPCPHDKFGLHSEFLEKGLEDLALRFPNLGSIIDCKLITYSAASYASLRDE